MDWRTQTQGGGPAKRWVTHPAHEGPVATAHGPHSVAGRPRRGWLAEGWLRGCGLSRELRSMNAAQELVTLDGSDGEGGGQILRTALTLSLLTGRPFRLINVRANREKPGLRPQHLSAVEAAAKLGGATVIGGTVGSRVLTFRPGAEGYTPRDLSIAIGTAGATALVLQTLHLPIALVATDPVRLTIGGGTFNTCAPSFPFLDATWRAHLVLLGAPIGLSMPAAGFYPRGGGRLDAWIEPAHLRPLTLNARGPLVRVTGVAGVSRLRPEIAERMRARAERRLRDRGIEAEVAIETVEWDGPSPGAALALSAEYEGVPSPSTFVGLGERGKPADGVADEAVDELLDHESVIDGAIDPHSADQILLPLALAPGRSEYTVSAVTEHLLTNARTVAAFLDREIVIEGAVGGRAGRVVVDASAG